jgi:hypothetical protein
VSQQAACSQQVGSAAQQVGSAAQQVGSAAQHDGSQQLLLLRWNSPAWALFELANMNVATATKANSFVFMGGLLRGREFVKLRALGCSYGTYRRSLPVALAG